MKLAFRFKALRLTRIACSITRDVAQDYVRSRKCACLYAFYILTSEFVERRANIPEAADCKPLEPQSPSMFHQTSISVQVKH